MDQLPPLDAHAHIAPTRRTEELEGAAVILAATLSPSEAHSILDRRESRVVWGVGCHPRKQKAQDEFHAPSFADMVAHSPLVGEVGLDAGSRVPISQQRRVFRQVLEIVSETPRILSIHSYRAAGLVLKELAQTPVQTPVLHWWTGTVAETQEAVALGCYFSVHPAVARHSKFRSQVPPARILVESDHGWSDPPAAIPCRIEWAEYLLSVNLGMPKDHIRRLVWDNFATILIRARVHSLVSAEVLALSSTVRPGLHGAQQLAAADPAGVRKVNGALPAKMRENG